MSIRVFLADDHRLLVEGFRHTLKDYEIDVVEVAYSLEGLVERYLAIRPDVLVIDIRFDSKNVTANGLDACEDLLREDPNARIVVFSQFDDQYVIENAYNLGVLAYVRKDETPDVLNEAIRAAASGSKFFSPAGAQLLAWSVVSDGVRNPAKLLDDKELKAFALTADGLSVTDIAQEMDVSTKTVGRLLKSITTKLGIENQADFTKLAIRFGVTTLDLKKRT